MAAKKAKWKDFGEARKNLDLIIDREKASSECSELLLVRLVELHRKFGDEALKILDGK